MPAKSEEAKALKRQRDRDRYARIKADPEAWAKWQQQAKNARARRLADEERAAQIKQRHNETQREWRQRTGKNRAYCRAWRARIMADPERREEYNANQRMDYRLRQEQQGRTDVRRLRTKGGYASTWARQDTVPAAPFAAWLKRVYPNASGWELQHILGPDESWFRRVFDGEKDEIRLDTVDRCVVAYGDPGLLHDLYPMDEEVPA
jgi:hypothetical protein